MYIFMGGTFDPIHQGHLHCVLQVSEAFSKHDVYLLPTKVPVHKILPNTSVAQRIDMIQLALEKTPNIKIDYREVLSDNDSYSIDTLKQLREELGEEAPIIMVIGMDSYLSLPKWKNSNEFLSLCHILVLQRPQYEQKVVELDSFVASARVKNINDLTLKSAGKLFFLEQSLVDVSASEVREQISNDQLPRMIDNRVADYIRKHDLYK